METKPPTRPGKTIAVYVEADQARAIERLAKRDYLSKSAVVRAALRLYLAVHAATGKEHHDG